LVKCGTEHIICENSRPRLFQGRTAEGGRPTSGSIGSRSYFLTPSSDGHIASAHAPPSRMSLTSRQAKSLQTVPRHDRYLCCRSSDRIGQGRLGVGPVFSVASRDEPATRGPQGQGSALISSNAAVGRRPAPGLVRRGSRTAGGGRSSWRRPPSTHRRRDARTRNVRLAAELRPQPDRGR
jgi:hypothetical protein